MRWHALLHTHAHTQLVDDHWSADHKQAVIHGTTCASRSTPAPQITQFNDKYWSFELNWPQLFSFRTFLSFHCLFGSRLHHLRLSTTSSIVICGCCVFVIHSYSQSTPSANYRVFFKRNSHQRHQIGMCNSIRLKWRCDLHFFSACSKLCAIFRLAVAGAVWWLTCNSSAGISKTRKTFFYMICKFVCSRQWPPRLHRIRGASLYETAICLFFCLLVFVERVGGRSCEIHRIVHRPWYEKS